MIQNLCFFCWISICKSIRKIIESITIIPSESNKNRRIVKTYTERTGGGTMKRKGQTHRETQGRERERECVKRDRASRLYNGGISSPPCATKHQSNLNPIFNSVNIEHTHRERERLKSRLCPPIPAKQHTFLKENYSLLQKHKA